MKTAREVQWVAVCLVLAAAGCQPFDGPKSEGRAVFAATDGTLDMQTPGSYATQDAALGDVDGDGDLDLALAVQGGQDIVFLSGPTGLQAIWQSPLSEDSTGIALGDMTGDGVLDLVTCGDTEPVRIFEGDGLGGFSALWDDAQSGRQYRDLALGDLTGDGSLDLILAVWNNPDRTYINNGTGSSFAAGSNLVPSSDATSVATGDLDGDGDVDIVVGRFGSSKAYINNGTGGLSVSWTDPNSDDIEGIALADRTGDGVLDIVTARNGGNRVWNGDGTGDFSAGTQQFSWDSTAVAVADHDGDGDLDLAVANNGGDRFYGSSDWLMGWWSAGSGNTTATAFGDMDSDGSPELVFAEDGGPARVYANDGLTLSETWNSSSGPSTNSAELGDIDGDGDLDLAISDNGGADELWLNAGDGTFSAGPSVPTPGARSLHYADFDGDGDLDLLSGTKGGDPAEVFLNDGTGTMTSNWIAPQDEDTRSADVGDFDGDGDIDFVLGNNNDVNRIYLNDGSGSFVQGPATAQSDATRGVRFADVDGDGDLDLGVGNNNGVNRVYLGDGSSLVAAWSSTDAINTRTIDWGDVDGDGDPDLLVGNDQLPNQVWLNDGSGSLSLSWSSATSLKTRWIRAADLDGDGDVDAAVSNDDEEAELWMNQGGGSWIERGLGGTPNGRALAVGDLDGDGDMDVVNVEGNNGMTVYSGFSVGGDRLPDDPTHPVLLPPAGVAWTPLGGGLGLPGNGVPVSFLLVDAESDPAATVRLQYAFGCGGLWTDAAVTGPTTDLASSPAGTQHTLTWDAAADGATGRLVSLRVVVDAQVPRSVGGPIQTGAVSSTLTGWRIADCFPLDADGDGAACEADCDEGDPTVFPGAPEVSNDGIDQDCNGADTVTCFVDADGDTFGGLGTALDGDGLCTDDAGQAATGDDCDDTDAFVSPGATEIEDDGIDQDCSGTDAVTCFVDVDGDTFGGAGTLVAADGDCADPGEAATSTDCNDNVSGVFPGAPEVCDGIDQDCDGDLAETFTDTNGDGDPDCFDDDDDGDGFVDGADCLPLDASAYPGALEFCDAIDQDCDGDLLETFADVNGNGTPDCIDTDLDGDGYAGTDCDDSDPLINPGATDIPDDGIDQDCSGADTVTCFVDIDGDGLGVAAIAAVDGDCDDPGEASLPGDCDDSDAASFPGAPEVADDGIDQDCSGADTVTCFVDGDGDGIGGSSTSLAADGDCTDALEAAVGGDCDDADSGAFPGATEIVDDGIDQDCDGADTVTCFVDSDGDGAGGTSTTLATDGDCADPGESATADDCDDTDASVFPAANEVVDDGIDQDCNGADAVTCFVDGDGDGVGGAGTLTSYDGDCLDSGEAVVDGDCNDAAPSTFPGAPELCDGVDQDCDGDLVEGFTDTDADGEPNCFDDDDDGDLFLDGGDCAPLNAAIYPGATEICDGIDQDCDGDILESFADTNANGIPDCAEADSDGDGYSFDDCDDGDASIYPGAVEVVDDGIDQDCSGTDTVTCFVDGDGDGVGDGTTLALDGECDDVGEAYIAGDCDDSNPLTFPGAPEIPDDGVDQDCSGDDATTCGADLDLDGYADASADLIVALDGDCLDVGETTLFGDCDDDDAALNPGASEICDAIDQDCDGDLVETFLDSDGDGLPNCAEVEDEDGDGYIGTDCDDEDATIFPGAPEIAGDGIDQDCNGADTIICFADEDMDGFGSLLISFAQPLGVCDDGLVLASGDCDDTNGGVFPGAQEICNGIDDNCDGELAPDELEDADGDGSPSCVDCDDENDTVGPDLTEDCGDGLDNDCDNFIDDGDSDCDGLLDNDGDGWCPGGEDIDGDGDCSGSGEVGELGDCDDADPNRAPGLLEICDGVDSDCSGDAEAEGDVDGDGQRICDGDCNDEDPAAFAGADEVCGDGLDQDCDGSETDEYDDPECWESGCGCAVPAEAPRASLAWLLVFPLLGARRRRASARLGARAAVHTVACILAVACVVPGAALAGPSGEVVELIRQAIDTGRCEVALDQARLLSIAHPQDASTARLHGDAARCAGRAREAVVAYRRVREFGRPDSSLDTIILSLQRSLGVVQVQVDNRDGVPPSWLRLRVDDPEVPETLEAATAGAALFRFSDIPADVPLTLLLGGRGLRRSEIKLPPLTPGELLKHSVSPEFEGMGSVALARALDGVDVFAEEDRGVLPLSVTPQSVTAGVVPLQVRGLHGTVRTSAEVPRGEVGAIFDPLPYLPAAVDLLHLPAGSKVRVVVETPDGTALSRSLTLPTSDGELDQRTGARIVERLSMDSLTGGSAGVFVIHPVLGTMVVSALLVPGETNSLALDWRGMDGVETLSARFVEWTARDAAIRKQMREPLVPSIVTLIGGGIAAAVFGVAAIDAERRAENARKDAVAATDRGDLPAVESAWGVHSRARGSASGLRVASAIAGGVAVTGAGLTIAFGARANALRNTVPSWDPWLLDDQATPEDASKTP